MKVAILCNNFIRWGGGIDFLRGCINALCTQKKQNDLELYLLVPYKSNDLPPFFRDFRRSLRSAFRDRILRTSFRCEEPIAVVEQRMGDAFENFYDQIHIEVYESCKRGLILQLKKIGVDVVLPVNGTLGKDFPFAWIGYIYDYQHKYLPGFFSEQELINRDRLFKRILSDCNVVIVNSKSVREDTEKFFPNSHCKIVNLPFSPMVNPEFLDNSSDNDLCQKYNIPGRYFLISNQFWVHKSHLTAFEALAILKNNNQTYLPIVCTGKTVDYRFPEYFVELENRIDSLGIKDDIYFLGYIDKKDQIALLQRATAILQPTLFEGGPGGGAVYEAVAYGVPAIVSNISVNLEIENEDILFFEAKSAPAMAKRMSEILERHYPQSIDPKILIEKGLERSKAFGDALLQAIDYAVKYR
jgi:glycosyltransferase involved in cell wall biosynthesis